MALLYPHCTTLQRQGDDKHGEIEANNHGKQILDRQNSGKFSIPIPQRFLVWHSKDEQNCTTELAEGCTEN